MKDFENYDLIKVFDDKAFERNLLKTIKSNKTNLGVVIKSNSYGIGVEKTIPIFEKNNISNFFCQDIIEALNAKKIIKNKNANIYTFAGVQEDQEKTFIKNKIIPICINLKQIENYNNFSKGQKVKPKIGIHFDTGMSRTGLSKIEVKKLSDNFEKLTLNLDVVLYVSHLHSSYNKKDKANKIQLKNFINMTKDLPKREMSLSATGGTFRLDKKYHFDMTRVGYGIYGVLREMEPVVSVFAKILQVRNVKKGDSIGYFAGFKARKNMKIAIINMGYKDGYLRSLSHTNKFTDRIRGILKSGAGFAKSYMMIGKYKCPVCGIISMNNTMIDVSNVDEKTLQKAKFVEVIGKGANLMDFRSANGFIPCDLLTSLLNYNPNAIDLKMIDFKKLKI